MTNLALAESILDRTFLDNELWRWAVLLGAILLSFVAGKIVSILLSRQASRLNEQGRLHILAMMLSSISRPAVMLALAAGLSVAGNFMVLTYLRRSPTTTGPAETLQSLRPFWNNTCAAIAAIGVSWMVFSLVDIVAYLLHKYAARAETMLDVQIVPLIRKALRVFVVVVAMVFIAQNIFELEIGPLLAGLGVGGLAFALAAKDMLANFFGSVTIFTDRPFALGHRIVVKGYDGVVEEVGFRSTRIRTLEGNLVTVPNSVVANEPVENIGSRQTIRRLLNLTIPYNTPPEKVQRAVEIVRSMLEQRKASFTADLPPRVYFNEFNADSLNVQVLYWFAPPDWWAYLAFNHDFNMELLRRFKEEGIEFAFPTRTLHVKNEDRQ
ncbi:MAG: mechanosensitive ion channel family protein [Planctomycetaceae bacterium]|nr:mechanosensitive ion channel family protein [Planctomycetaceae bacterium]